MEIPAQFNKFFLTTFTILSAVAFFLSAITHVAALLGKPGPLGDRVWIMYLGILFVVIPAVFVSAGLTAGAPQKRTLMTALRCPTWTKYGIYTLFAYASVNLILGFSFPQTPQGPISPIFVRVFSPLLMVLYAVSLTVFYSASRPQPTS